MAVREYRGHRHGVFGDEWEVYVVDARGNATPLPPRHDLANHSPDGFSWGFSGSGPAQLALALLAHHIANSKKRKAEDREYADVLALGLYQAFKAAVIAAMDQDQDWVLTANDVDRGIAAAERNT